MADYSNTRINLSLYQKLESERSSDRAPHATGNLEIKVEDLNEFFSLALALKPVENYKGDQVIKLRCAAWHRETRANKPYESLSISPEKGAEFKEEDLATPHTAAQPVAAGVADDEEL